MNKKALLKTAKNAVYVLFVTRYACVEKLIILMHIYKRPPVLNHNQVVAEYYV